MVCRAQPVQHTIRLVALYDCWLFSAQLLMCRGWKADNAVNNVAEKTNREGTDLQKSTRVQHSGSSDDDSSSDDE